MVKILDVHREIRNTCQLTSSPFHALLSSYYAGGFVINNVQVPGSVIASADLYLMWRPRTMAEVTPNSLAFLEIIKPAPEASDGVGI